MTTTTQSRLRISVDAIDAFHELDPRASITSLKFFLHIADRGPAGLLMRQLTWMYGFDRHTTQKAIRRLTNMGVVDMEVFDHLKKRVKLSDKGWDLYTKMSCL